MAGWKHKKNITKIVGDEKKPVQLESGQVIINKKATAKHLDKLVDINEDGNSDSKAEVTNDGRSGGILKGKPHYDKNGNPTGGIPSVVDGSKKIEVEGEEFVVNKEASEKHWKELSKINQSAGNGVPIGNPNPFDENPEEYSKGGKIEFNANHTPSKYILNYAEKIKTKYPEIWDLGGNIFGNEAYKNLKRVAQRGYWLDSEEWMYIKWRSYVARHKGDFRIEGVIAMLKWVDKVEKGWSYMKNLIQERIDKIEAKKKKMKDGGNLYFTSYEDAMTWIENESKKYKSKNEFYSTDIYKKTYPIIQKLYQEERKNYGKKGIDIMKSLGLDFGDKVFYDFVSPFGYVENYSGTIINKNGIPYVKLDEGQKTISGKTSIIWNKGWSKRNTNEIGGEVNAEELELRWDKKKNAIQELANNIHKLRYNVTKDLSSENEKDFLTALVISIIDKTGERVGNEESANNGHFGVTGFKKKHISVNGNKVTLKYIGKSGVEHETSFTDEKIANALKKAISRSASDFIFSSSDGFQIKANKINRYLSKYNVSAKDLRGYSANNWIIEKLNSIEAEKEPNKRKKQFNKILSSVAEKIGHGRATLKKHYLVPELENDFVENGKIVNIKEIGGEVMRKGGISNVNDKNGNIKFMEWYVDWYKKISDKINITFSLPNILLPFKEENVVILDLFEKIDQNIDAKPYLKEIVEKADEFSVTIYLEPTPRYKYFLKNIEKRKKISKDYLISYYQKFGFELTPNKNFMKRLPKSNINEIGGELMKEGGVVTYKQKYNKKYGYDLDESHDLEEISKDTGVSIKGLQQIYNKGVGAFKTNPSSVRPNVKSAEQWAMARVYSAVMGGKTARVDANELKMEEGGGVEYSAIQEIIEKVKPYQDELTEKWVKAVNEKGEIKLTDWDIEMYRFMLTMDLVKAVGNYIEKTDSIKDLTFTEQQDSIIISCIVIRNEKEYNFQTEVIIAGGYNIQKLHLRYIVKTNLPNKRVNPYYEKLNERYKKMTKAQKLKEQISFSENAIKKYEIKLNEAKELDELSDSEIEKLSRESKEYESSWKLYDTTWETIVERGADKNYDYDKSQFENSVSEGKKRLIDSYKRLYGNVKGYEFLIKREQKEIEKLNKKIAELGVTKMQDGGEINEQKLGKIGQLTRLSMKPFAFKEKFQFIKDNPEILAGKFFEDGGSTSSDKVFSASSRFRPYETIVFDPPLIGLNGAKLVSYTWAYEMTMQPNWEGELVGKRVSDWTQAEISAETGRGIVHQYTIQLLNGTTKTVSSESVPILLGYVDRSQAKVFGNLATASKTLAKQQMKLAILEAQKKEYDELYSKFEKAPKPVITLAEISDLPTITQKVYQREIEEGKGVSFTYFKMGDVIYSQDNNYNYNQGKYIPSTNPNNTTIEQLTLMWISERVKEAGGVNPRGLYDLKNRVERQKRKVEQMLKTQTMEDGGNTEDFDWMSLLNEIEEDSKRPQEEKEADEKERWFQEKNYSKKWATSYKDAVSKTVKEYLDAKATYDDWGSRQYKQNKGMVYLGGDDIFGEARSIGSINEARRQKVMRGAKMQMDEAIETLKELRLSDEEISNLLENKMANGGSLGQDIEMISTKYLDSIRTQDKSNWNYDLEKSIENEGVLEPVIISYYPQDNVLALTDGHNRLDTAIDLGIEKIPAKLVLRYDNPLGKIKVYNSPNFNPNAKKPSDLGIYEKGGMTNSHEDLERQIMKQQFGHE